MKHFAWSQNKMKHFTKRWNLTTEQKLHKYGNCLF